MRSFPLPVRLAAGAAVSAVECTRQLPSTVTSLPVTLVSQVLQTSMRLQQQVTQLAVKGDTALSGLQRPSEQPEWATFDEDEPPADPPADGDAAAPEERHISGYPAAAAYPNPTGEAAPAPEPPCLPGYDALSIPQLRGKLRTLSETDLVQLIQHEHAHRGRQQFETMLRNRLDRVRQPGADTQHSTTQ